MLEQFANYFQRIEMPQPIIDRAEAVCNTFRNYIPAPVTTVFVTDAYQQPEGARRYGNLWLFTGSKTMECKNFVVQTNIDLVTLTKVQRIEWNATELNDLHGPSTINSRLDVKVAFDLGLNGSLTAVHNNCAPLADLVPQVFLPKLG
jgi:hypothetical protein